MKSQVPLSSAVIRSCERGERGQDWASAAAPVVGHLPLLKRPWKPTGVATRPIKDMDAYYDKLSELVFRSSLVMRPIFTQAKCKPVRVAYGDGEDERVLRALQRG